MAYHILSGFVREVDEYDCFELMVEPDSLTDSSTESVKKPSFFFLDIVIAKQEEGKIDMGYIRF